MLRLLILFIVLIFISNSSSREYFMGSKFNINRNIDFSDLKNKALWKMTNDDVMGGLSNGRVEFTDNHMVFLGKISIENNGGFSATYRVIEPLETNVSNVDIEVQGDGNTYQIRLIAFIQGYRVAYQHEFKTKGQQKESIRLLFKDFVPTFRGRVISNVPKLNAAMVNEIGFLMTKKKPSKFKLKVFHIKFGLDYV